MTETHDTHEIEIRCGGPYCVTCDRFLSEKRNEHTGPVGVGTEDP